MQCIIFTVILYNLNQMLFNKLQIAYAGQYFYVNPYCEKG